MAVRDWIPAKLANLIKIKHGFAFDGEYFRDELPGDVLLTPGNFAVGGGFKDDKFKYYVGPVPDEFVLGEGDLLVTMTDLSKAADTLGYPALVPSSRAFRFLHNQRLGKVLIRPGSPITKDFLYYLLRSRPYRNEVLASATGTTVKHTSPERIRAFNFLLPSLGEQRAIAHILGTLDDKIELNRRMNETLEAMARTIFKSWFIDFDPVRAKAEGRQPFGMDAETAALFPDSFRDSPLGRIPKGWKVCRLVDVALINGRTLSRDYTHETIEYLEISSVSKGRLLESTKYEIQDAPSRAKRLVAHGDTIWSCVRPNRKSYLFIHNPVPNLVVSTGFAVLTPKQVSRTYLFEWVTTDDFVEYLSYSADGSAYPAIRPERFSEAELLLPPLALLDRFEQVAGPMRDKIAKNDNESCTLAAIRDALLPKLISGEVRVKDVEMLSKHPI